MNTMLDRRGRTKRRGNYQPYKGRTFRIVPLTPALDDYCTHCVELDGKLLRDSLGHAVIGSATSLREILYRGGANEEAAP